MSTENDQKFVWVVSFRRLYRAVSIERYVYIRENKASVKVLSQGRELNVMHTHERSFFFDEQKAINYYKECADIIIKDSEEVIEQQKRNKEKIRIRIHPSELPKFEGDPLF